MVRMYTFRDEESVELKQGMAKNSNMFLNIDTLQDYCWSMNELIWQYQ